MPLVAADFFVPTKQPRRGGVCPQKVGQNHADGKGIYLAAKELIERKEERGEKPFYDPLVTILGPTLSRFQF